MESTIKIDFESSLGKPVIKIITPNELTEDSDVRDKLIHEFLHTPPISERNELFTISSYYDLKSPFKLTTIEPLNYFDVLYRLKWGIILRIMGINNASECREFYDFMKKCNPDDKGIEKSNANYNNYLKVIEFFDWVSEQPYIERKT